MNVVVEDFDASVAHFDAVFGSLLLTDLPQTGWHACLLDIGRVIFEVFAPHEFFLHSKHGPHHFGIEYQADMGEVRATLERLGVRVIRELGVAVHTHPADGLGIAWEFYEGWFHDNPALVGDDMKPASYWRDEHPLGITGLHACTILTPDPERARTFLTSLLACEERHDEVRAPVGGRAIGLGVADSMLEILAPTGKGTVLDELVRNGEGLHSTVFSVRDLDQAMQHLADLGVDLEPGTAADRVAIAREQNRGIVFELTEGEAGGA